MLRIAVCDDDATDRAALQKLLASYLTKSACPYTVVEYCAGEPLADDYADGDVFYHLVFLDIFTSGMNGIETARKIRQHDRQVAIVFLSPTPNYALESYDVRAYGYLIKPLNSDRAEKLLTEFLQKEHERQKKSLVVREEGRGGRGGRIPYCEIEYIESERNRILIHLEQGAVHAIYAKLDDMDQKLREHGFLRCHQSFIVNMEKVSVAKKDFLMVSGARVPIRQRGAKAIRESYVAYILSRTAQTKI